MVPGFSRGGNFLRESALFVVSFAMNISGILPALLLVASHSLYADEGGLRDTSGTTETISIASEYSVEIEYPNFVISILAHLTGVHFERLKLEEWDFVTPSHSPFFFRLTREDDRWLELASDSTYPSFLMLPRSDRVVISPEALDFGKSLVRFFKATGADTLHAVFEYGGDTLGARAFRTYSRADFGTRVTTFARIETWNRDTREEYINGDIQTVTEEGITKYQDIRVSLKNKNINMHFTPLHIDVAKSGELTNRPGGSTLKTQRRTE